MAVTVDNPREERYEISVDGELAGFAEYRGRGAVRAFTHTEIDRRFAGRGLATELVRAALDDARRQGVRVVPTCAFVRRFLIEYREYLDLVDAHIRAAFGLPDPSEGEDRTAGGRLR